MLVNVLSRDTIVVESGVQIYPLLLVFHILAIDMFFYHSLVCYSDLKTSQ